MKPKVLAEINGYYKKFKVIFPDSFSLKSYVTIYDDFEQLKKQIKNLNTNFKYKKKKN